MTFYSQTPTFMFAQSEQDTDAEKSIRNKNPDDESSNP
jgi:hypothetical protein